MKIQLQNPTQGPLITVSFDDDAATVAHAFSVIGASRVTAAASDGLATLRTAAQFSEVVPGTSGGAAGVAGPLALLGMLFSAGDSPQRKTTTEKIVQHAPSPAELRCLSNPYDSSAECATMRSILTALPFLESQLNNPNAARASGDVAGSARPSAQTPVVVDLGADITPITLEALPALFMALSPTHWAAFGVADPQLLAKYIIQHLANTAPLPAYIDPLSLWEMLHHPKIYLGGGVSSELLTHGTNSASLPGVIRHGKLIPLGESIKGDPSFMFSGDLLYWILYGMEAYTYRGISTAQAIIEDPHDLQGLYWRRLTYVLYPNYGEWMINGEGIDFEYSNEPAFEPGRLPNTVPEEIFDGHPEKRARWHSLSERLQRGWEQLTPFEQGLVMQPFPMIYQSAQSDPSQHLSINVGIINEISYQSPLVLGKEIETVFVPRQHIDAVQAYFDEHNIRGMAIHSIESLRTFRFLFGRYYQKSKSTSPDYQP